MSGDDVPLFPVAEGMKAPAGNVELAYTASVQVATTLDALEGQDAGMSSLAVELARAADLAGRRGDVRGLALIAKELREVSSRLQLDPTARGDKSDPLSDLLAKLNDADTPEGGTVSVGDSPHA